MIFSLDLFNKNPIMSATDLKPILIKPKTIQQKLLIETFLKALKLEIFNFDEPTKMSKDEFEEKLNRAKSDSGTILKSEEDINSFFDSL